MIAECLVPEASGLTQSEWDRLLTAAAEADEAACRVAARIPGPPIGAGAPERVAVLVLSLALGRRISRLAEGDPMMARSMMDVAGRAACCAASHAVLAQIRERSASAGEC